MCMRTGPDRGIRLEVHAQAGAVGAAGARARAGAVVGARTVAVATLHHP
jgi:hypothetical protein